jgi:hypothetical protein
LDPSSRNSGATRPEGRATSANRYPGPGDSSTRRLAERTSDQRSLNHRPDNAPSSPERTALTFHPNDLAPRSRAEVLLGHVCTFGVASGRLPESERLPKKLHLTGESLFATLRTLYQKPRAASKIRRSRQRGTTRIGRPRLSYSRTKSRFEWYRSAT